MKEVLSTKEFEEIVHKELMTVFYFSHDKCNVCKVLKPKVAEALEEQFPKVAFYYIQTDILPDVAAQHSVFTVPTVLVFIQGKESYRYSRNLSIPVFLNDISRPYSMLF